MYNNSFDIIRHPSWPMYPFLHGIYLIIYKKLITEKGKSKWEGEICYHLVAGCSYEPGKKNEKDCLTCALTYRQDENQLQKMNLIQEIQSLACFHMCQMDVISCIFFCLHGL